jgi:hypothetical protein
MREQPHNSPEQVRQYLGAALAVVEALDIPPELREVAFAKAVDLFSSKQLFFDAVNPAAAAILRPQ